MKRFYYIIAVICFSSIFLSGCRESDDPPPEPITYFPVLEVSGSHYEIGYAIGETFKSKISTSFSALQNIYNLIDTLISTDQERFYDQYLDTVTKTYPHFIQELQGMADGSNLPFRNFFISSMIPEYVHLLGLKNHEGVTGCSTVSFVHDGKLFLSHNEDGNYLLKDLLFIVKAHPTGKPSFNNLVLPGLILSVAPAMNDAGIFYSGNYVTGTEFVEGGIPYAFVERSIMEATTMDEAIAKVTNTGVAYCFHINIASGNDERIVSLEVTPDKYYMEEVDGFFVHTNHFIQPGMTQYTIPNTNSESRYEVLKNLSDTFANQQGEVTGDLLTEFLSSHEQWINSPCSHGNAENHISATLGSTLFDITAGTWRISFNNPCEKKFQTIEF